MNARLHGAVGSSANSVGSDLRELAEPTTRGEKIQQIIDRAARRAGLSYWRAFNIWFGKARRIDAHERDAIADAVDRKRNEATRNEIHDLRIRLARLESLLAQRDADFHRPAPDRGREPARGPRGTGRAVAAKA